ncbi:MAG: methylated-DNA--[protein]-cysteine S-methyltransferase [candidate division Zixibacteria bacterium]|nr:methylated-DNA--[protein]-cysteine S-methyltransferase [candidate division Zixibacteria bacterium]
MIKLHEHAFSSAIGTITLLSSPAGICYVHFGGEPGKVYRAFIHRHFPGASVERGGESNDEAARQILAYLDGKLTEFTVPLDLKTTPFYAKVLAEVKRIPYGKTKTYGEIAVALGKPGASRAVGGANASNPIPLFIPCHRVIASDGLCGYAFGLPTKIKLLRLEGVAV